jgi:hypothetical protein
MNRVSALVAAALTVAVVAAIVASPHFGVRAADVDDVLAGAIDMHVHEVPDSENWRVDAIDVARIAHERGMRGVVLKSHWHSTAEMAYLVRKVVPGIEVFGGLGLSSAVGGINPAAIEEFAKITGGYGRVVWLPTLESEAGAQGAAAPTAASRPVLPVSRNGELLPEVKAAIRVIGAHNLIMATGHSSGDENVMLVREGHRQGLKHMIVTHALSRPARMTIDQMKAAAAEGAYIEIVYVHTLNIPELRRTPQFSLKDVAEAVRAVGARSIVLSTDMGQVGIMLPTDGLAAFATGLKGQGITDDQINQMIRVNPARLLDLPVQ